MSEKKVSVIEFFNQVKTEVKKISWATRQQVVMATILILVVSCIAALFFFSVDQITVWAMKHLYAMVG